MSGHEQVAVKPLEWREAAWSGGYRWTGSVAGTGIYYAVRRDKGVPDLFIVSGWAGVGTNPYHTLEAAKAAAQADYEARIRSALLLAPTSETVAEPAWASGAKAIVRETHASLASTAREERQTFVIPDGFRIKKDADGRALGIEPIPAPTAREEVLEKPQYWKRRCRHGVQYAVMQLHFPSRAAGMQWVACHHPDELAEAEAGWSDDAPSFDHNIWADPVPETRRWR